MFRILLILFIAVTLAACGTQAPPDPPASERPAANKSVNRIATVPESSPSSGMGQAALDKSSGAEECRKTDTGDNILIKEQTFAIDFAPFKHSCFVTSHNAEYDDPPLESEFAIYTSGKRVFDFPDKFNGVTFGCWVEAVAFQDLNDDALRDVIVVSKCSAKTAPYNENAVYRNNGKGFETDLNANYKLTEFRKAKDIAEFVKRNRQMFFD
ncbi:MAG: hypothetical protein ABI539_00280 [Acidobacteriota bacterium]